MKMQAGLTVVGTLPRQGVVWDKKPLYSNKRDVPDDLQINLISVMIGEFLATECLSCKGDWE